jgi:hypothetical protein
MNTLVLNRPHWLASLLAWLRRPAVARPRRQSKPVVRIAGLR